MSHKLLLRTIAPAQAAGRGRSRRPVADRKQEPAADFHGMDGSVAVRGKSYHGVMPAWGDSLSDPPIAAVATYVRRSWGNTASGDTAAAGERARAATATPHYPWNARELIPSAADAH